VEGKFERGACIRLCGVDGVEFARGLADYSSHESARLAGCKSSEIETVLGYYYGDVIVHRDNLVLL
jgi:glutamate 5-kinase